jgi:hypothetical protein
MASTYDLGDIIELSALFQNTTGGGIDPTSVKFLVEDNSGTVSTYSTVSTGSDSTSITSTGRRFIQITATSTGRWEWHVHSTGTGEGVQEDYFMVRTRRVTS